MPNDVKISLELKDDKENNLTQWSEFHNGVATGLRLSKVILYYYIYI